MSDVPVINPETNEAHLIPEAQVNDALAAGGKRATKVMNPATNQAHYIPDEVVPQALKAGGRLMGASPAPPRVNVQPVQRSGVEQATAMALNARHDVDQALGSPEARDPNQHGVTNRFAKGVGRVAVGLPEMAYDIAESGIRPPDPNAAGEVSVAKYAGPGGLAIKRSIVDPMLDAYGHINAMADRQEKDFASHGQEVPLGSKIAKFAGQRLASVPLVGPMALSMGENTAKTGDVAGTVGEVAGMAAAPEVSKYTKSLFKGVEVPAGETPAPKPTLTERAGTAASNAAIKGIGAAGKVVGNAGMEFGKGVVKGVAQNVAESAKPLVESAQGTVNDAIKNIQADSSYKSVTQTISKLREDLTQQMKDAKVSDLNAKKAIDKIVNHIQDKFEEYTTPGVGGGSQGATPETASFIEKQVTDLQSRIANARRGVVVRGPKAVDRTGETPVPQLDRQGRPVTAPGFRYQGGEVVEDPSATGTARTPFSAAAASEAARGNPDLWKVGTTGQRMGGFRYSLEQEMRKVPVVGGSIAEPFDARGMTTARNVLGKAIDSLNPDVASAGSGQGMQQLVSQVDRTFGAQLSDSLEKVRQMAPDAQISLAEETKKGMLAASKSVPALEGVTRRLASGEPISLADLKDVRRQIREYEGQVGPEGKQVFRAAAALDADIVRNLEQQGHPEAAQAYKGVSAASRYMAAQVGTGVLRKLLDARSPEAFDHLIDSSPEDFNKIMDSMRRERGVAAKVDSVARQGMLQRMADRSAPPGERFNTKMFSDLVESNRAKLGPDFNRFKLIADGMKQLEHDQALTSRFGAEGLMKSPATSRIAQLIGAVVGGAAKVPFVELGIEATVPRFMRYLMTPTGMEEMTTLSRLMANYHGTPKEQRVIDYMSKKAEKNIEAQEKAGVKQPIGKKQ